MNPLRRAGFLTLLLLACSGPNSFELVGALRLDPNPDASAPADDAVAPTDDAVAPTDDATDTALIDTGIRPTSETDRATPPDAHAVEPVDVTDAQDPPRPDAGATDAGPTDVPTDLDPSARCGRATNCGACVAIDLDPFGCGWCAASATCLYGTEAGALRGSCAGGWATTCR